MADEVHARFRMDEIARIRCSVYKNQNYTSAEGLRVKMYPVHGEPFGTPSGELMMVIANPEAAQVFSDAPLGQEFDFFISPVPKQEDA